MRDGHGMLTMLVTLLAGTLLEPTHEHDHVDTAGGLLEIALGKDGYRVTVAESAFSRSRRFTTRRTTTSFPFGQKIVRKSPVLISQKPVPRSGFTLPGGHGGDCRSSMSANTCLANFFWRAIRSRCARGA